LASEGALGGYGFAVFGRRRHGIGNPEPDIALLKPRNDFYAGTNPGSADIILLIEVADSSPEYDTTVKKELYAILGVHEYWVADLVNHHLLVFHDPHDDSYTSASEFHPGDRIAPQLLQDCQIDVNVLLP
jgi:Uma2 family endonuclease